MKLIYIYIYTYCFFCCISRCHAPQEDLYRVHQIIYPSGVMIHRKTCTEYIRLYLLVESCSTGRPVQSTSDYAPLRAVYQSVFRLHYLSLPDGRPESRLRLYPNLRPFSPVFFNNVVRPSTAGGGRVRFFNICNL